MTDYFIYTPSSYDKSILIDRLDNTINVVTNIDGIIVLSRHDCHLYFEVADRSVIENLDDDEVAVIEGKFGDDYHCFSFSSSSARFVREVVCQIANDHLILVDDDHGLIQQGDLFVARTC